MKIEGMQCAVTGARPRPVNCARLLLLLWQAGAVLGVRKAGNIQEQIIRAYASWLNGEPRLSEIRAAAAFSAG